jgi:hypothetical protein
LVFCLCIAEKLNSPSVGGWYCQRPEVKPTLLIVRRGPDAENEIIRKAPRLKPNCPATDIRFSISLATFLWMAMREQRDCSGCPRA